jgi:DNA-binding transcriptional regulator YiaG
VKVGKQKYLLTGAKIYDISTDMNREPIDIKAIRLELGFTQEDLARKLGLTLSAVSKWEQGIFSPSRLARGKIEKLLRKEGRKK